MSDREDRGGGGGRGRGRGRGRGGGGGGGDRGDRDDSKRGGAGGGRGGAGGGRGKIHGLTYTPAKTPSFLKAFQAQLAGAPPPGSRDDFGSRSATELGEDGQRAALPGRAGRQTSEEREEQERLDGNEFGWGEGGDDAPQVVVLKEGKHLSLEEMEDEQRKGASRSPSRRSSLSNERFTDSRLASCRSRCRSPGPSADRPQPQASPGDGHDRSGGQLVVQADTRRACGQDDEAQGRRRRL